MTIQNVIIVNHGDGPVFLHPKHRTTEVVMTLEEAVRRYTKQWVIKELLSLIEHVETLTDARALREAASSSSPRRSKK